MSKRLQEYHFWASVSTGWEEDCLLDIKSKLGEFCCIASLSVQPDCFQGGARFSCHVHDFPKCSIEMKSLRFVDFIHVTLVSGSLLRNKTNEILTSEKPLDYNTTEYKRARPVQCGDNSDSGLDTIRTVASLVQHSHLLLAIEAFQLYSQKQSSASPMAFRVNAKRGGKGMGFSSDEVKRVVAISLQKSLTAHGNDSIKADCKAYDFVLMARVHRRSFWLGLILNAKPLSRTSGAPRPRAERTVQREAVPNLDTLPLSQWAKHRVGKDAFPRDARDVATPLYEMGYDDQLKRKASESSAALLKFTKKASDAWTRSIKKQERWKKKRKIGQATATECTTEKGHGPELTFPEWIKSGCPFAGIYHPWSNSLPYRNKIEVTVGQTKQGDYTVGYNMGRRTKNGKSDMMYPWVEPVDACSNIHPDMVLICNAFSKFLVQESQGKNTFMVPWRRVTMRGSVNSKEIMVKVQYDPTHSREGTAPDDGDPPVVPEGTNRLIKTLTQQSLACKSMRVTSVLLQSNDGKKTLSPTLMWGKREAPRPGGITEVLSAGAKIYISPSAFFQVSTEGARYLYSVIGQCVVYGNYDKKGVRSGKGASVAKDRLLDVCCGCGSIGIAISKQQQELTGELPFRSIIGIEIDASAVDDAVYNAALNGYDVDGYAKFICGKAENVIPSLVAEGYRGARHSTGTGEGVVVGNAPESRLVAIIDPPRTGMHPSVFKSLRNCALVRRIVYVCCNPTGQFARWDFIVRNGSMVDNAALLCSPVDRQRGLHDPPFLPAFSCAVDLFPNTPHQEMVVVFDRA